MSSDWIIEQQEQEHKDSVKEDLAMQAAQLVISRWPRDEAIKSVIDSHQSREDSYANTDLWIPNEDGQPAESFEYPSIEIDNKKTKQIKAIAATLIDDIEI